MTILWAGLSVGAIYTLVALGYNIPLAQTGIFNFAQGQIVVFGTFFAWFVMGDHGWPWWVAIVGGFWMSSIGRGLNVGLMSLCPSHCEVKIVGAALTMTPIDAARSASGCSGGRCGMSL